MASVRLEKSLIDSVTSNIMKFSNEMSSQLMEIYSLIAMVKEIWESNSSAMDYLNGCSDSVKCLNKDYGDCCTDFLQILQQSMAEYELEDARTSMKVSSLDGRTIATMSISAGAFSTGVGGFDFGKISRTATDVTNGNFIDKSMINSSAFRDGEYTFQYFDDDTVRIDKDGVPMVFTTKENADRITGIDITNGNFKNQSQYDVVDKNEAIPLVGGSRVIETVGNQR